MFPKFPSISDNDSDKVKHNKIKEFMYKVIDMFELNINIYYKVYYLIQVFRYVIDYSDIMIYDIDSGKKNEELVKVLRSVCKVLIGSKLEELVEKDKIELFDICNKVIQLMEDY